MQCTVTGAEICGAPATARKRMREWFYGRCSEHRAVNDEPWTPGEWDTPMASVCRFPEPVR